MLLVHTSGTRRPWHVRVSCSGKSEAPIPPKQSLPQLPWCNASDEDDAMTNPHRYGFRSAFGAQLSHNGCDVKFYGMFGDTQP